MLNELIAVKQMWSHLRCSREQIVEYQNQRLRQLVEHAYNNVPYYRAIFDAAGIKPRDIQTAADLMKMPLTSKSDIHARPGEDFLTRGIKAEKLITRTSGGSTGQPIHIRRTWAEERLLNAFRFRALKTFGMTMTDRRVYVGLLRGNQAADRRMLAKLVYATGLYRLKIIDVLQPIADIVQQLKEARADVITGYSGAVSMVAQKLIEENETAIRPCLVVTSAEVQTPLMREQMAKAFQAPVYNIYGANEVNLVGWECVKTGQMHISDDSTIVEVLRDNTPAAPGQRGEVAVTSLHSYAMPIIRFRLADVATRGPESCSCGLPFSTISAIQGRMIDYFPMPDGRLIHPYEFIDKILYDRAEWTRQYQFIQERQDLIVMRVVVSRPPTPERMVKLRSDAARLLGEGVEFRIDFFPELEFEPSGKFRTARSLVRSAYDSMDWERDGDVE